MWQLTAKTISKEDLNALYWKQKLSTHKIAKILGCNQSIVFRLTNKYEIPTRKPIRFSKTSFSGNEVDKAYMLGLRTGDLYVRKHRNLIRVQTGTTHPAMLNLFKDIFGSYGHINRYPSRNKLTGYMWFIDVLLNNTFNFLLEKLKRIPRSIKNDTQTFMAFLAGYFDAEGNIDISHDSKGVFRYKLRLISSDYEILSDIKNTLTKLRYNPKLYKKEKLWEVRLHRKNEVINFLQNLPLKHKEKVKKKRLLLKLCNDTRWLDVKEEVIALRKQIKKEVMKCIEEARLNLIKV